MNEKRIYRTPDQFGYKDRGMMKWQGLILSDHTEAIKEMKQVGNKKTVSKKTRQSMKEVSAVLAEAYQSKQAVSIQANILRDGSYTEEVHCMIVGSDETKIYLLLKDGRITAITLDDIHHIELLDSQIWYQKK